MLVIPAIDLLDGQCVRLIQGRREDKTVYSDDPAKTALRWEKEGAEHLHLVDLDGAFEGESKNLSAVRNILETVEIPLQLGGGIRSVGAAAKLLSLGIDRVILGTAALTEPEIVNKCIERFGSNRIVVGIDAKDGMVAVKGWEEVSKVSAVELALKMKKIGVERVVYTDVSKDGMLKGPNVEATRLLAKETNLKIIASGGVSSSDDIRTLAELEKIGVEAVIVGKALYEGKVSLKDVATLPSLSSK